jgi:hypothetical protein
MEDAFVGQPNILLITCTRSFIHKKRRIVLYVGEGLLPWAFSNFQAYTLKVGPLNLEKALGSRPSPMRNACPKNYKVF